jgi:hypothetical protein
VAEKTKHTQFVLALSTISNFTAVKEHGFRVSDLLEETLKELLT